MIKGKHKHDFSPPPLSLGFPISGGSPDITFFCFRIFFFLSRCLLYTDNPELSWLFAFKTFLKNEIFS